MFNDKVLFELKIKKLVVKETRFRGERVRILCHNGAAESAVFLDENMKDELVFDYMREFLRVFSVRPDIKRTLLLGGAAFTFPMFVTSRYEGVSMDVCEIDPLMVEIAKKFFGLPKEYESEGRGEIIIDDAKHYIKNCKKKYHAVFHDAYTEDFIEKSLLSEHGVRAVKRILAPGGIYAINYITALTGMQSMQGIMAKETLKQHFKNVQFFPCNETVAANKRQNCIILAGDGEI